MSDSIETLRHRIDGANDLQAVVRTMKALSAANIGQYERAVQALAGYYQTVTLGLAACLRAMPDLRVPNAMSVPPVSQQAMVGVVVFGSDQGLIGQFNDQIATLVQQSLPEITQLVMNAKPMVWVVGERLRDRCVALDIPVQALFNVPNAVNAITRLVGELVLAIEQAREQHHLQSLYLFHHQPQSIAGQYLPVKQCLLPLDRAWQADLAKQAWPTAQCPETLGSPSATFAALIREYLFVSLFRACAESQASENASRLLAMQRAEKNIGEMLDNFTQQYHQLRQESIDAELFDVIAGLGVTAKTA